MNQEFSGTNTVHCICIPHSTALYGEKRKDVIFLQALEAFIRVCLYQSRVQRGLFVPAGLGVVFPGRTPQHSVRGVFCLIRMHLHAQSLAKSDFIERTGIS